MLRKALILSLMYFWLQVFAISLAHAEQLPYPLYPKCPKIFGQEIHVHPDYFLKNLEALGFVQKIALLNAPYVQHKYVHPDPAAPITSIELWVCNHPAKLYKLYLKGSNREQFYRLVKTRFKLGVPEIVNLDGPQHFPNYQTQYADNVVLRVEANRKSAELQIIANNVQNECNKALTNDLATFAADDLAKKAANLHKLEQAF